MEFQNFEGCQALKPQKARPNIKTKGFTSRLRGISKSVPLSYVCWLPNSVKGKLVTLNPKP